MKHCEVISRKNGIFSKIQSTVLLTKDQRSKVFRHMVGIAFDDTSWLPAHKVTLRIFAEAIDAVQVGTPFRAGLYRLFGPDGGLARYVQEQRLNRALRLLASPASRGKRLIDLAVDFRFSSDSTFVRAFRRQFGRTPGEIMELAEAWRRETDASPAPHDLFHNLARS